jgi:hypothetical protein
VDIYSDGLWWRWEYFLTSKSFLHYRECHMDLKIWSWFVSTIFSSYPLHQIERKFYGYDYFEQIFIMNFFNSIILCFIFKRTWTTGTGPSWAPVGIIFTYLECTGKSVGSTARFISKVKFSGKMYYINIDL